MTLFLLALLITPSHAAECRANLKTLVQEKSCDKIERLFRDTAVKCQKTLIVDESVCPEGCSYGEQAVRVVDCLLEKKKISEAKALQSWIAKSLDPHLCYEEAGESSLVRDALEERLK